MCASKTSFKCVKKRKLISHLAVTRCLILLSFRVLVSGESGITSMLGSRSSLLYDVVMSVHKAGLLEPGSAKIIVYQNR